MSKEQNKTDKGFELIYWNLSYRRKFIRTLWLLPIVIIAIILLFYFHGRTLFAVLLTILLVVVFIIQTIYTYKKHKASLRDSEQAE